MASARHTLGRVRSHVQVRESSPSLPRFSHPTVVEQTSTVQGSSSLQRMPPAASQRGSVVVGTATVEVVVVEPMIDELDVEVVVTVLEVVDVARGALVVVEVEDDVELVVAPVVLVEEEVELLVLVDDDVELLGWSCWSTTRWSCWSSPWCWSRGGRSELLVLVDEEVELLVELVVLVDDEVELLVELLVLVDEEVELLVELVVLVDDEVDELVLELDDDDVEVLHLQRRDRVGEMLAGLRDRWHDGYLRNSWRSVSVRTSSHVNGDQAGSNVPSSAGVNASSMNGDGAAGS